MEFANIYVGMLVCGPDLKHQTVIHKKISAGGRFKTVTLSDGQECEPEDLDVADHLYSHPNE